MLESAFSIAAIATIAACSLVFIVLKYVRAKNSARMRRDEEREAAAGGICRYGANADGEIIRVRVKRD